jgi:hypothetical protein
MQFERWTIDEVTDSTATLLRSRFLPALAALLPASLTAGDAQPLAAGLWSDEVDLVLDRARFEAYIKAAVAANGQEPRGPSRGRRLLRSLRGLPSAR